MKKSALFPATMMPDKDWWHTLWSDPEAVLRSVGITKNMQVVDLCCGDGHFTQPMCELVNPGEVWALDLDADLLDEAQALCEDYASFHAVLADARELPKRVGNSIDYVFIANTFHGVPEKQELAKAVHQSLKKGGRFTIVNWYRLPRETTTVLDQPRGPDTALRMQPDEVIAIVEPAGFKLEKVVDIEPYHYAAVFIKQ